MKNFSELPLSALLKSNLAKHGFVQPTPVQAAAIEPALEGRDVVATAQTGIRAVVLAPTRELAIQIHETFAMIAAGSGISAAIAVGGLNEQKQLQTIRKGAQVLIATPGRMSDFVGRKLLNLRHVQILVLDEADRMLDMGFLPTIEKLMAAMPADRHTLFFSASLESSVKQSVETS